MTESCPDEFLLSLPSIPVPPPVTAVAGCSCGGLDWHDQACAIWAVPHAEALAAIDAARRRLREHTDGLNRQLQAALARIHPAAPARYVEPLGPPRRSWKALYGPLDPAPPIIRTGDRSTHRCDDRCACPVDGLPMFYAPSTGEHACQDPGCEYAQPHES